MNALRTAQAAITHHEREQEYEREEDGGEMDLLSAWRARTLRNSSGAFSYGNARVFGN
jgi:hypothetical protein